MVWQNEYCGFKGIVLGNKFRWLNGQIWGCSLLYLTLGNKVKKQIAQNIELFLYDSLEVCFSPYHPQNVTRFSKNKQCCNYFWSIKLTKCMCILWCISNLTPSYRTVDVHTWGLAGQLTTAVSTYPFIISHYLCIHNINIRLLKSISENENIQEVVRYRYYLKPVKWDLKAVCCQRR